MNIYTEDISVNQEITNFRAIALNILIDAIAKEMYVIHFELRNNLTLIFRKGGERFIINAKEQFGINTLHDGECVCREFCSLFKNSMTQLYDVHGGSLKYILENKDYSLRYSACVAYPLGMDILVQIFETDND